MDLLKKAFTTPVKREGADTTVNPQHQVSPEEEPTTSAPKGIPFGQSDKQQFGEKLPATDAAIASLQGFTFNPNQPTTPATGLLPGNVSPTIGSPGIAQQQYVMFSPPTPRALEPLNTEEWPYPKDASPNPIAINRAREILAAAMAEEDCELPGADIHGHAWVVENEPEWTARAGTGPVSIPTRPPVIGDASPAYYRKKDLHRVYMHVVLEGKKKLIEWFGKSMFVDMHVNKALPTSTTPRDMLEHLEKTYAKPRHYRQHMEAVRKAFDATFDKRKPVEVYYMRLQDCKDDSRLLR